MLEFLAAAVKAKLNVLISGGTGTGKTTMLNVLSAYIPDQERIIKRCCACFDIDTRVRNRRTCFAGSANNLLPCGCLASLYGADNLDYSRTWR
jgi:ABC-type lipoprotein export system ATPase subunit